MNRSIKKLAVSAAFFGTLVLSGAASAQSPIGMLDDFEGSTIGVNRLGGRWGFYDDQSECNASNVCGTSVVNSATLIDGEYVFDENSLSDDAHAGSNAAMLDFEFGVNIPMSGYTQQPFVGMATGLTADGSAVGNTFDNVRSVTFWAKAAAPTRVKVEVQITAVTDHAHYHKFVDVTTEWAEYEVVFSPLDLAQPSGWGAARTFNKTQITTLQFHVGKEDNGTMTAGTVWIDDVELRDELKFLEIVQEWNIGHATGYTPTADVVATLYKDGTFVISGTGDMYDLYSTTHGAGYTPWNSQKNYIDRVIIEEGVTSIMRYAFQNTAIRTLVIPNSVTTIGTFAFSPGANRPLTSVTIGEGVETIGDNAFAYNLNLESIIMLSPTPPTLGETVFSGVPNSANIYVPDESVDAYRDAYSSILGVLADNIKPESEFTSIRHMTTRRNISSRNAQVSLRGRTLNVRVAQASASSYDVRMIDMRGRQIAAFRMGETGVGTFSLARVPAGKYVVEVRDLNRRIGTSSVVVR